MPTLEQLPQTRDLLCRLVLTRKSSQFEVSTIRAPTTTSGTVLTSYAAASAASAAVSFGIMAWTEKMLVILSSRIIRSSIYSRETTLPVAGVACRISPVTVIISDTASTRRPTTRVPASMTTTKAAFGSVDLGVRQVDDGEDTASEIDHALDVGWGMWEGVEEIHPLIYRMARMFRANSWSSRRRHSN